MTPWSVSEMSKNKELEPLRHQIDEIDEKLLNLINDRVRLASEIGSRKTGLGAPVYRPEREVQILERLIKSSQGPLSEDAIKAIFREIISAARGVEASLTVAVLGPKGTFTEQAAYKVFGQQIDVVPASSIKEVFRLTETGAAHFGVVPVENSTEGGVNATLDLMLETELTICNEVDLRVSHCLLAHADTKKPETIAGHEQALAQCRGWLAENFPQLDQVATSSTADAARAAADDPGILAVASELAGRVYGLEIRAREIEDVPGNTTRFLVISKQTAEPSGRDKTSIAVANPDQSGALLRLLEPFADSKISMTRIESRPMRPQLWRYVFFIDIEGHIEEPSVSEAVERIKGESAFFRLLGSYPRSI